ncbi:MAG TPA: winged helix-turn-helix domain-containing protein [Terriglobales bacterium]|nr:winged helix-turn-helix domain-containing protein [Terriglobales bacterium]
MGAAPSPSRLHFGRFELDPRTGELLRQGVRVHIQDKPLRLLQFLLRHPGELVSRPELHKELWPAETFLDFEDGLNTAVRKLREALGDSAERPRYLQTVPRRGYRWIAPVREVVPAAPAAAAPAAEAAAGAVPGRRRRWRGWAWAGAAGLALAAAAAVGLFRYRAVMAFRPRDSVLIADMDNQTGDARLDRALDGALAVSLEQSGRALVFPRDRLPAVLRLMDQPAHARITPALGREICRREGIRALIAPGITRTGQEYALTAELIDPASGATVRSYSQRAHGQGEILDKLGQIADAIRRDLGESLFQVEAASRPLPQVTTASLAALQDYAAGQQQWDRGRFPQAVTLYRAALADDPHFAMAHAALAEADCSYVFDARSACQAQYAQALASPQRLTDRERLLIATSYADDTGQFPRALTLYQDYLRQYPDDWDMLNDYAHLLRLHGRAAEALGVYRQVLRVAPDDAHAYIEMATAEMDLGDNQAALRAYRRAFALDPHWQFAGDTNREYGFTLVRAGQLSQAAAAFDLLLQNPEWRATGLTSLARLEFWQGRAANARAQALAGMQAAIRPDALRTARSHLLLGQIAAACGDRAGAERELAAAGSDWAHLSSRVAFGSLLGQEWARLGEEDRARQLLAAITPLAAANKPQDTAYLRLLQGEIAVAQGHPGQGLARFGLPDPAAGSAVAFLTVEAIAHADQRAGHLRQAALWYRKVIAPQGLLGWEPQPRAQAAYYWLARDDWALGHRAAAAADLAPLLSLLAGADADFTLRQRALALAARLGRPPSGAAGPGL